MKKTICLLALFLIVACKKEETPKESLYPKVAQTPIEMGKEIFEDKGNCVACHQPNQKVIGPSIQEIAKIYKDKKASIVTFLQGNAEPIVDPSQYEVMKTNFAITKMMSDEELQAIEAYIYSHLN
jgi:cytochrome c